MRAKIVAWICLITMIVTFTGCNKTQDKDNNAINEVSKASYVEQKISEPDLKLNERQISLAINDENQVEYYTVESTDNWLNSSYNCYTLVDGSYQKVSVDWVNKAASDFGFEPADYICGEDGYDYLLYLKSSSSTSNENVMLDELEYGVIKETKDSKGYVDITPDDWEAGTLILGLQVNKDGMLCYREESNLLFYDPINQKQVDYGDFETYQDYVIQGNTLYYIPNDVNEIQVVQLEEDTIKRIAIDSKSEFMYLLVSKEGEINLLDNKGIHQYKDSSTMWETIVDGSQLSMSSPSYMILDFIVLPDTYNSYYVLYGSTLAGQEDLFAAYQFTEDATSNQSSSQSSQATKVSDTTENEATKPKKRELNIYTAYSNNTLDQAINQYTINHPDVKINLTVGISFDDLKNANFKPVELYDSIRTFNTELLAGCGADIMLMDGLPMASYIEKGILMDMSDCFSDLLEENNLQMSVADNYIQDGKIYSMPMRYFIPVCTMREDISEHIKSIENLASFCQSSKMKLMDPIRYRSLVQMFLYLYGNEIFSEDGELLEERLSSFLTSINVIAKQTGATADGNNGAFYPTLPYSGTTNQMRTFLVGDQASLTRGDVLSSFSYYGDSNSLMLVCDYSKMVDGSFIPVNDLFVPNGIIGINSDTKDEELAKDFVSYLFCEELQAIHIDDGFPLNNRALDAWSQEPASENFCNGSVYNPDGTIKSIMLDPVSLEDTKKAIDIARNVTNPVFSDINCLEMIVSGTIEYLKGEKTLEQATAEISQKVNLYLSE